MPPFDKPRPGWPPGLLQDDDKKLSKWLASRPDSMLHAREAAAAIEKPMTTDTPKHGTVRWTGDDGRHVIASPSAPIFPIVSMIAQHIWIEGRGWVAITSNK